MVTAGWIAILLEIILLITWIYNIFFKPNGTDPAGKGLAIAFVLGLILYIAIGIVLMLVQRTWSIVLVLMMASVPVVIVLIGVSRQYPTKRKE